MAAILRDARVERAAEIELEPDDVLFPPLALGLAPFSDQDRCRRSEEHRRTDRTNK
jgi:hypothetical protein